MKSRLLFQVLLGETRPLWAACVQSVAAYCERHWIKHVIQRDPILRICPGPGNQRSTNALRMGFLPIFEKTSVLGYLEEFDQVAVMDADFYAAPDAPNLFDFVDPACDMAAVLERDLPLSDRYKAKLDRYERMMFEPLAGVGLPFFNGGLMAFNRSIRRYIPESPRDFLARPEFQRFVDGVGQWRYSTDQVLWNWFARSSGLKLQHLDARLNWLYGMVAAGRERDGYLHHFLLSDHLHGANPEELLRTNGRPRV